MAGHSVFTGASHSSKVLLRTIPRVVCYGLDTFPGWSVMLLGLRLQRTGLGAGTKEQQREEPSGQTGRAIQGH